MSAKGHFLYWQASFATYTPTKKEFEFNATLKCSGEGETWTDYGLIGLHSSGHLYLKWGNEQTAKMTTAKRSSVETQTTGVSPDRIAARNVRFWG